MTAPTGKTFAISAVSDFVDVPEDRLDACLHEFAIAVRMAKLTRAILEAGSDALDKPVGWRVMPTFNWIDDVAGDYRVDIKVPTADGPDENVGSFVFDKDGGRFEPVNPEGPASVSRPPRFPNKRGAK